MRHENEEKQTRKNNSAKAVDRCTRRGRSQMPWYSPLRVHLCSSVRSLIKLESRTQRKIDPISPQSGLTPRGNSLTHCPHHLYVYFDPDHPVYAVPAAAGRYRIAGFVGVNRVHEIEVRHEFRSSQTAIVMAPFTAPARTPVYLGDFMGQATFDGALMEWRVNSCTNNFTATTAEFRKEYPNLGSAPATSRWRLLQDRPGASEHRP